MDKRWSSRVMGGNAVEGPYYKALSLHRLVSWLRTWLTNVNVCR